jgi:Rrf2 family protein
MLPELPRGLEMHLYQTYGTNGEIGLLPFPIGFRRFRSDPMKLSNKGRYGLQAVFDLAYHNEGRAAQIKDICDRQSIPARFLEQVFRDLKKAGIVRSKRGPRGGYELARAADDLRVGDIVRAIEGPISLAAGEPRGRGTSNEVLREALAAVSKDIEACLDRVSVAELCARAERLGLARNAAARYVYAI